MDGLEDLNVEKGGPLDPEPMGRTSEAAAHGAGPAAAPLSKAGPAVFRWRLRTPRSGRPEISFPRFYCGRTLGRHRYSCAFLPLAGPVGREFRRGYFSRSTEKFNLFSDGYMVYDNLQDAPVRASGSLLCRGRHGCSCRRNSPAARAARRRRAIAQVAARRSLLLARWLS